MTASHGDVATIRQAEDRSLVETFAGRMIATMQDQAYGAAHCQMMAADARLAARWSEIALAITRAAFEHDLGIPHPFVDRAYR